MVKRFISVEIKTKCEGKFCSKQCCFFRPGVISDWCDMFGDLKRVKDNERTRFISYRHPDCFDNQIIN